jgi:glycosyltransferase involved in cell wall biosynthesis
LDLRDAVVFDGFIPNDDLMSRLDAGLYDIAVMPSFSEGVPVALMEAAARGLRVVATDVCGVGELVGEEEGRLVPPGDVGALTVALRTELDTWQYESERIPSSVVRERYCLSTNVRTLRLLFEAHTGRPTSAR